MIFMSGKFLGIRSESWEMDGRSGVVHKLGLATYESDKWGQQNVQTVEIRIPEDFLQDVRKLEPHITSKPVTVSIHPIAKEGRKGVPYIMFQLSDPKIILSGSKQSADVA